MAATGVGRPWMRGKLPGANDQEWRIASGNAYGGNVIATYLIVPPLYLVAQQVHVDSRKNAALRLASTRATLCASEQ
jgi:hypothetical protein